MVEFCRQRILGLNRPQIGEVIPAFWRGGEFPLRETLDRCPPGDALILPLLMNDGYFSEIVFPRELAPEIPRPHLREVRMLPPLGLHEEFENAVAGVLLASSAYNGARKVILVGHGTEKDIRSARRTWEIAEFARNDAGLAQNIDRIEVAFLDQEPRLDRFLASIYDDEEPWILLPWFSADGSHAAEDIPAIVREKRPQGIIIEQSVGASVFPMLCASIVQNIPLRGYQ